jgi:hypothetical protein
MSLNITDFTIGQITLFAWREGRRLSPGDRQGMKGIAEVIRSRVEKGWLDGDWLKVIEETPIHSANEIADMDWRTMPDPRDQDFVWLIGQVASIYARQGRIEVAVAPDVNFARPKANMPLSEPTRALFYGSLQSTLREWFIEKIVRSPLEHPRVADSGTISFYA